MTLALTTAPAAAPAGNSPQSSTIPIVPMWLLCVVMGVAMAGIAIPDHP